MCWFAEAFCIAYMTKSKWFSPKPPFVGERWLESKILSLGWEPCCVRSLSDTRELVCLWESCQSLEHLTKSSFRLVHFLLFEVKPSWWLGITIKHPSLWCVAGYDVTPKRDVGSKWGSKLQETYHCVSSLVCLIFVFILHILCFHLCLLGCVCVYDCRGHVSLSRISLKSHTSLVWHGRGEGDLTFTVGLQWRLTKLLLVPG